MKFPLTAFLTKCMIARALKSAGLKAFLEAVFAKTNEFHALFCFCFHIYFGAICGLLCSSLLCFHSAPFQNQGEPEKEENEFDNKDEEENAELQADESSPREGDINIKNEEQLTEQIVKSEWDSATDKTDAKSCKEDSLEVKVEGEGENGSVSLSSSAVDNKENETKGDEKQSLCCKAQCLAHAPPRHEVFFSLSYCRGSKTQIIANGSKTDFSFGRSSSSRDDSPYFFDKIVRFEIISHPSFSRLNSEK